MALFLTRYVSEPACTIHATESLCTQHWLSICLKLYLCYAYERYLLGKSHWRWKECLIFNILTDYNKWTHHCLYRKGVIVTQGLLMGHNMSSEPSPKTGNSSEGLWDEKETYWYNGWLNISIFFSFILISYIFILILSVLNNIT